MGLLLIPGAKLDRYELVCPIAQGGMAQVWVARLSGPRGFEKLAAIKMILTQHAGDPLFQSMLLDEARLTAEARHPNVVQVTELGETDELMYLVMEWVPGLPLRALMTLGEREDGRVPLGVALRIVADACAGLHHAHELRDVEGHPLGVVHRDISPTNLLISESGATKVIDFGIAKAMDRVAEPTSTGIIKGKVSYMAPEQAAGHAVDRRADIWAIGVVLYRLLAARLPFEGGRVDTLGLVARGTPAPPVPDLDPRLQGILDKSLAPNKRERYATAELMQHAVERASSELCGATTATDVARYLKRVGATPLEERRRLLKEALSTMSGRVAADEEKTAVSLDPSGVEVARTPDAIETDFSGTAAPSWLRTSRPWMLIAVAAVVVIIGGIVALSRMSTTTAVGASDDPTVGEPALSATSTLTVTPATSAPQPAVPHPAAPATSDAAAKAPETATQSPAGGGGVAAAPNKKPSTARPASPAKRNKKSGVLDLFGDGRR